MWGLKGSGFWLQGLEIEVSRLNRSGLEGLGCFYMASVQLRAKERQNRKRLLQACSGHCRKAVHDPWQAVDINVIVLNTAACRISVRLELCMKGRTT